MDTSGTNGTVIFDRDDHPMYRVVAFVEREDGNISILLNDKENRMSSRIELLSEYVGWVDNIDFTIEYNRAIDKFFRAYFTESEWTLAALSIP